MKKTYINPTAKCYIIQTRNHLLSTSTEIAVSTNNFDSGTGEILGREFEFEFEDTNKPLEDEDDFEY